MLFTNLKEQEKEQRKNYILDAAEKMFFSRGYDNVSVDDIASEIGLNKATLSYTSKTRSRCFFQ